MHRFDGFKTIKKTAASFEATVLGIKVSLYFSCSASLASQAW